jgi:hypothetical protein
MPSRTICIRLKTESNEGDVLRVTRDFINSLP